MDGFIGIWVFDRYLWKVGLNFQICFGILEFVSIQLGEFFESKFFFQHEKFALNIILWFFNFGLS